MIDSDLSSLYKNKPMVLWVEDPLVRTYLGKVWEDSDIALLVAGGNDAVHGAVRDARTAKLMNVFGFRDCDFIESNVANWMRRECGIDVFVPNAHEVENHFLDFQGLSQLGPDLNPQRRTMADLRSRAQELAEQSLWWMGARATIADVRTQITANFPKHPKWGLRLTKLTGRIEAEAVLADILLVSNWGTGLKPWVDALDTEWIRGRVDHHEKALRSQLNDGTWRWGWSGKEIFKELAGYIAVGIKAAAAATDLAKGLATWQRENNMVDVEIVNLRRALRMRVDREPWPSAIADVSATAK